jgi:hypothetical protein
MILRVILAGLCISAILFGVELTTYAQPYGQGKYNANVPYGSQTQLSIATSGNVAISITPNSSGVLGTSAGTVTVTSSDVSGYSLYARANGSSSMANGAAVLGASSNVSPATLAVNTWGYNTDGTTNFLGLTTSDSLLKTTSTPATAGDATTVTYGVNVDNSKPAGSYSSDVLYTAVPHTN